MTVSPAAVVVAIAKAVEQVVFVTVSMDILEGTVVTVASCSPDGAVRLPRIAESDCTASSKPPATALESSLVLLLRAVTEAIGVKCAVIDTAVCPLVFDAACTAPPLIPLAAVNPLFEAVSPNIDIVPCSPEVFCAEAVVIGALTLPVSCMDSLESWVNDKPSQRRFGFPCNAFDDEAMDAEPLGTVDLIKLVDLCDELLC